MLYGLPHLISYKHIKEYMCMLYVCPYSVEISMCYLNAILSSESIVAFGMEVPFNP